MVKWGGSVLWNHACLHHGDHLVAYCMLYVIHKYKKMYFPSQVCCPLLLPLTWFEDDQRVDIHDRRHCIDKTIDRHRLIISSPVYFTRIFRHFFHFSLFLLISLKFINNNELSSSGQMLSPNLSLQQTGPFSSNLDMMSQHHMASHNPSIASPNDNPQPVFGHPGGMMDGMAATDVLLIRRTFDERFRLGKLSKTKNGKKVDLIWLAID